jgi:hypothetical protein
MQIVAKDVMMVLTIWRRSLEPMEATNVRLTCCSFGVNRRMIKEQEHGLGDDPTEVRVNYFRGQPGLFAARVFAYVVPVVWLDVVRPDPKEPKIVAEKVNVPLVLVCLRLYCFE